jgi:hypothetical protein
MAYYLVTAIPKENLLQELELNLKNNKYVHLKPFGKALTYGLKNARKKDEKYFVWEEEDYCTPPLREEREAVLDKYFFEINVEKVSEGEAWKKIKDLPKAFNL